MSGAHRLGTHPGYDFWLSVTHPVPRKGPDVGSKAPEVPHTPFSQVADLGPQAPLGPAGSPASVGVCSFLGPHPQSQPPPCPLAPGGAGGPCAQPPAWGAAELKEGPAAGTGGRCSVSQFVLLPPQSALPAALLALTLAFLAGTVLSGNRAPSFSSSPSWDAGLGLWQLWLGALSSAGGWEERRNCRKRHSCTALPVPCSCEALEARTFPSKPTCSHVSASDVPFCSHGPQDPPEPVTSAGGSG